MELEKLYEEFISLENKIKDDINEFMNFKHNPKANTNGCSLQRYLPEMATKEMVDIFGPSDANAYWDQEAGYDGYEWKFEADDGSVAYVYARFGSFRVGARDEQTAQALAKFLGKKATEFNMEVFDAVMRARAVILGRD